MTFGKKLFLTVLLFIMGFWLQAGDSVFAALGDYLGNCSTGEIYRGPARWYDGNTIVDNQGALSASRCANTGIHSNWGKVCPTGYTYYDINPIKKNVIVPNSACPPGQKVKQVDTINQCGSGYTLTHSDGSFAGYFVNTSDATGYSIHCTTNPASAPPSCGNSGVCYRCEPVVDVCPTTSTCGSSVYDTSTTAGLTAFNSACSGRTGQNVPGFPQCKFCCPDKFACTDPATNTCMMSTAGTYTTELACEQACCEYKCPAGYTKLPAGADANAQATVKCGAANLVGTVETQPETAIPSTCTPAGATPGQCVKITCNNPLQPTCPDPNPNTCPAGQTLEQYEYTDPTTGTKIPCNRCIATENCACPTGTAWTGTVGYVPTNANCPTGQRLRATNPWQRQVNCPTGQTPQYCYRCETCTCPVGYRTNACPAGYTLADTQTVTCNPNLTCNRCVPIPGSGQCEPRIGVETRLYGYVVSDPKNQSRLQPHNNGLQYCRMFGSQAVGTNSSATQSDNPLARADFNVSITGNGVNSTSNANDNQAEKVISAVGYYRFNNLNWNTDSYNLTLRINNRNQSGTTNLDEGQHGVWVCSCPKTNYLTGGDPFTCSYTQIPVPSPSNDCVGGDDGMSSTGPYTIGDSNPPIDADNPNYPANLERLIRNINGVEGDTDHCYNPPPNFYVTVFDVTHGPWWQASGGMVYGDGGLESHIPTGSNIANTETTGATTDYNKCVPPHCAPYLIAQTCNSVANSTTPNTSSYPLVRNGVINLSDEGGNAVSSNANSKTARSGNKNTAASNIFYGPREDYAYFSSLIPDFDSLPGGSNVTGATSLSSICGSWETIGDGRVCHVSSLQIANGANIEVNSGKHTIFVTGDMNIGDATADFGNNYDLTTQITVGEGAYLGFIVGGNINIAPHVGRANQNVMYSSGNLWFTGDSDFPRFGNIDESQTCQSGGYKENGVVQGVYIASGRLTIQSNANPNSADRIPGATGISGVGSKTCNVNTSFLPDKKFVGEGTFVGWSGVDLYRTFDDNCTFTKAWHDRSPTEVFNYRPDFLQSAPEWMYRSIRLRLENV